jgi:hypothetical protein
MQFLNHWVSRLKNILVIFVPLTYIPHRSSIVDYGLSQKRHHSSLSEWIIEKQSFFLIISNSELPTLSCVSDSYSHCLSSYGAAVARNHVTTTRKCTQMQAKSLIVVLDNGPKFAILINTRNSIQLVHLWNTNFIQKNETVINAI